MQWYKLFRPLIYKLTPERIHGLTISALQLGGSQALFSAMLTSMFRPKIQGPEVKAFGLTFKNPLGMAAGYDKDGLGWRGLGTMGFGHIELGTVTPIGQPGNPEPRIFRLVDDQAVINRMGFPNRGAEFMARRLRGDRPADLILGMNIGKNKNRPLEEAAADYLVLLKKFAPLCDYLAVNVSSPNTPDLRKLQGQEMLEGILKPLAEERDALVEKLSRRVPILVKLAPDLSDEELDESLAAITGTGMDGVIISNTTISRPDFLKSAYKGETGGLSGRPLNKINNIMLAKTVKRLDGALPVVASGGVMSHADAQYKLDLGAVLVQLYTGLIYEGPSMVKNILNQGLKLK